MYVRRHCGGLIEAVGLFYFEHSSIETLHRDWMCTGYELGEPRTTTPTRQGRLFLTGTAEHRYSCQISLLPETTVALQKCLENILHIFVLPPLAPPVAATHGGSSVYAFRRLSTARGWATPVPLLQPQPSQYRHGPFCERFTGPPYFYRCSVCAGLVSTIDFVVSLSIFAQREKLTFLQKARSQNLSSFVKTF